MCSKRLFYHSVRVQLMSLNWQVFFSFSWLLLMHLFYKDIEGIRWCCWDRSCIRINIVFGCGNLLFWSFALFYSMIESILLCCWWTREEMLMHWHFILVRTPQNAPLSKVLFELVLVVHTTYWMNFFHCFWFWWNSHNFRVRWITLFIRIKCPFSYLMLSENGFYDSLK